MTHEIINDDVRAGLRRLGGIMPLFAKGAD